MNTLKSLEYGKVYPFTNENLSSYGEIFGFSNKNVLSVLGSGDQYFSFLLFGAKKIDLFDINNLANYYFALKYYSILNLSYEEYVKFTRYRYSDTKIYLKVSEYLPDNIRKYLDSILISNRRLSDLTFDNLLNQHSINFTTGRVIPFYEEELFYHLKEILKSETFPRIYNYSLSSLYEVLDSKYDLMFFSNIFMYLNCNIDEYMSLLNKYLYFLNSNGEIQANYSWSKNSNFNIDFKSRGLNCYEVPSVRYFDSSEKFKDYVFTLKKKN